MGKTNLEQQECCPVDLFFLVMDTKSAPTTGTVKKIEDRGAILGSLAATNALLPVVVS